MQTHEWEALLDGTTEGPWFANVRGFGRIENIGPISTGFSIGDGLDCDEDDAILAAHAPAAVAEVIRLRRRLERMRENYELIATHADHPQALGVVHQINEDLARILEGDTDE